MYLVPKDIMASKLDPAWVFLSGAERHFEEGRPDDARPGEREHAIVLPVYLSKDLPARMIAVGLLIDDLEAVAIARFMFGIPTGDVSPDDITDACKEACNVLGSCLVTSSVDVHNVEIGLPQELPPLRFAELQGNAVTCVTFSSEPESGHRVVVTVFDAVDHRILEA